MADRIVAGMWIVLAACLAPAARAQVPQDQARAAGTINDMIAVLQHTRVNPSGACLQALQDMHTTETQIKQLGGSVQDVQTTPSSSADEAEQSELEVARDVLATDIDNTRTECMADARRICAGQTDAATTGACAAMERDLAAPAAR